MPTTISDNELHRLTAAAAIKETTRRLRGSGIESAARDARLLVAAALGCDSERLISQPEARLDATQTDLLHSFVQRRLAREPVSRILGMRGFYGRDFEISPAVLDPRPDSETLIEAALDLVGAQDGAETAPLRILDIGTGSGCLLVTLLAELPHATGLGTDIDPQALDIAQHNARRHGVQSRASWMYARSLNGIGGPFDLVVANPPYVPTVIIDTLEPEVRDFDPRSALNGGADGLEIYREIAADLARVAPNGWAVFEVGKGQSDAVSELLSSIRVRNEAPLVRVFRDLNGVERCVAWRALK